MKIGQKGLIVLSIPLIFEIAIASSLWAAFNESQQKAKDLATSREIILKSGSLSRQLFESSTSLMLYNMQQDDENLEQATSKKNDAVTTFSKLETLYLKDKRRPERMQELHFSVERYREIFEKYIKLEDLSLIERFARVGRLRRDLQSLYTGLRSTIAIISNEEKEREGFNSQAVEKLTGQIQLLLFTFLFASVLITVWSGFLFNKNIVARLRTVERNSQKLGARQPLDTPVSGNDEIRSLDDCLHETATALKQAEEDKQKIIAMLSHDLRSPLQSVRTILSLIEHGAYGKLTEAGLKNIERSRRSIQRVVDLVDEFLELEKVSTAKNIVAQFADVNLADAIENALDIVNPQAESRGIPIAAEPAFDAIVSGDEKLLVRLFTNLLSNAVKFSPDNSEVLISMERDESSFKISIIDRGVGIEPDALPRIFEPFFQARAGKQSSESSGLGLAVCREIVQAHGGEISASSIIGEGSTFTVTFPKHKVG